MPIDETLAGVRPQHPPATPLRDVAAILGTLVPDGDLTVLPAGADGPGVEVTGVSLSSRRIRPGDLYAALPGARTHGVAFLDEAVRAGAVAVLTDPEGAERAAGLGVPVLVVPHPRVVLGRLSARLYGDPAAAMTMIGVTGTQGKTTTTRLAEGGLQASGVHAAVVGTVGTRIDGEDVATSLTTPEAPDLHGLFARMRERGVSACAMEVSSHALVMGRVDGVVFDCAVFLNLGRDHLDFHVDVEDYYRAKASLFSPERARRALVNVDDEHGRRLLGETRLPVATFSVVGDGADWTVSDVELGADRSAFTVVAPDGSRIPAGCPVPGGFNVSNTLAAVAACAEAGLDPVRLAAAIAAGPGVPGRFERVDRGQDFTVIVDYAHKPDAVTAALETLRPLTTGRLLLVLGAGGDRDRGKRAIMGEIGGRLADLFVVTDDNPRTEDPAVIRAEMTAGARAGGVAEVVEVGERRAAITLALTRARAGDVVLVAGKGHEGGQEVAGVVHVFDDREVVAAVLGDLVAGADPGAGAARGPT
ncbi:MAG: UDP-N-acetylmuramoyl-L-alanyl-D-glutamate--2,6-diaminopimelate ligase [Nocardioides sp.]|nr:UDP-N-acetylmuramoyl-L-alanyl-D-glutamate--2,6-diaminopimelate ligase [Nocardioides sp.]